MSKQFDENRRQFLSGGALRRSESKDLVPEKKDPLDRQSSHFERYSKNAMACEFELLLNMHQYPQAGESALTAFAIFDSVEEQMSIYQESSELSHVNQNASREPISLEQRLFDVLNLAREINNTTAGAFDITALPLSRAWGFHQRQGSVPDDSQINEALELVGMQNVLLDDAQRSVHFLAEGIRLDLGGIGKGFAIDLAAQSLRSAGVNDFVLQGGQSSVSAAGTNIGGEMFDDAKESGGGWRIGLSHPTTPNFRLAEFDLQEQALGTSGTQRQGFFYKGRRFGHIIDPRTGFPTDHCLSSTVICNSAAAADALATAFFVMQLEEVHDFCNKQPEVATILVYPDTKSGVRLETFNCDKIVWRKLI